MSWPTILLILAAVWLLMPAVATPFVAWHILRGRENCTGGHRCGCRPPAAPDGRHDLDPTLTLHQRVALVRQLDRQWEAS